jgi:uncharacterized protein YndB with AHSA1/START domain
MNVRVKVAPVKQSIVVEAPIERAFKVFTEDFGSFKPPEHNLLRVAIAETVFERRVGGYIYDRDTDGSECRWARVLAYEPPHRVLLSWNISPQWQIETDPEKTSEWEVRFTAETPNRTRVELSIAPWNAMARIGKACATVSPVIRGGRCICGVMPVFSPTRPDAPTLRPLGRRRYFLGLPRPDSTAIQDEWRSVCRSMR